MFARTVFCVSELLLAKRPSSVDISGDPDETTKRKYLSTWEGQEVNLFLLTR